MKTHIQKQTKPGHHNCAAGEHRPASSLAKYSGADSIPRSKFVIYLLNASFSDFDFAFV
jgi:hypothetical protein